MPDDNSGESVKRQPVENGARVEVIIAPMLPQHPSGIPTQAIPEQPKKTEIQIIEDRVKRAEWWMIWLTAAIAFSGLCGVVVGYMQWREISAGSTDTHTLAQAADTQAKKMADMSTAANKIRMAAENMVVQDQRIADNAQKALEASNRQSKAALDTSIAAFRLDQRAWIAAVEPSAEGIEVDAVPKARITWFNTGKTFGRHVYPSVHLRFSPNTMDTDKDLEAAVKAGNDAPVLSIGVIAPQNKAQSVLVLDHKLSVTGKSDFDRFYTYIWGELSYGDVFGRTHKTTFCAYRRGTSGDFLQCPIHNDAD